MELKINEYKIRLAGTANISKALDRTKNYDLVIKNTSIIDISNPDNHDGTYDQVFKLVISELSEIQLIGMNEAISAKKKGSQSKVLRYVIEQRADKLGIDREIYYQKRMSEIINEEKDDDN